MTNDILQAFQSMLDWCAGFRSYLINWTSCSPGEYIFNWQNGGKETVAMSLVVCHMFRMLVIVYTMKPGTVWIWKYRKPKTSLALTKIEFTSNKNDWEETEKWRAFRDSQLMLLQFVVLFFTSVNHWFIQCSHNACAHVLPCVFSSSYTTNISGLF